MDRVVTRQRQAIISSMEDLWCRGAFYYWEHFESSLCAGDSPKTRLVVNECIQRIASELLWDHMKVGYCSQSAFQTLSPCTLQHLPFEHLSLYIQRLEIVAA